MKYFSYGSNINLEQMERRLGHLGDVKPGTPHTLKDWKLVFDAGYRYASQTFANVVYEKGAEVIGLIYDLNERQIRQLEMHEMLYNRMYFKLGDEKIYTFVAPDRNRVTGKNKKPFLAYLNIIIDGARKAGLNQLYNDLIEYKEKNYKLKKGNKHKKR